MLVELSWNRHSRKLKCRKVYGVVIGVQGEEKLKLFCDRVWTVKYLMAEDVVLEELFKIELLCKTWDNQNRWLCRKHLDASLSAEENTFFRTSRKGVSLSPWSWCPNCCIVKNTLSHSQPSTRSIVVLPSPATLWNLLAALVRSKLCRKNSPCDTQPSFDHSLPVPTNHC